MSDTFPEIVGVRLTEIIGKGASGVTYQGEHLSTGKRIVAKVLDVGSITEDDQGNDGFKQIELFEREAKTLKQLRHAGVPRLLDFQHIEVSNRVLLCLIMSRAEGQTLDQLVSQGHRFSALEVRSILSQIGDILSYLHQLSPPIIHRDITPANILWHNGRATLVDFGAVAARIEGPFSRDRMTVVGTSGYAPYEQFSGMAVPASDFYGLGCTAVFLLTHHEPYELAREGGMASFRNFTRIADEPLLKTVTRLIVERSKDRIATASELRDSLAGKRRWRIAMPRVRIIAVGIVSGVLVFALIPSASKAPTPNTRPAYPMVQKDVLDLAESGRGLAQREKALSRREAQLTKREDALRQRRTSGSAYSGSGTELHKRIWEGSLVPNDIPRILESGVDLNGVDENGNTALHLNYLRNRRTQIYPLVEAGADVNIQNKRGETVAHLVAKSGQLRDLLLVLSRGIQPADLSLRDVDGNTPLHIAARHTSSDQKKMVMTLIDYGASREAQNRSGKTPEEWALSKTIRAMLQRK